MNASPSTIVRWPELRQMPLLPGISAAVSMGSQLSASLFLLEANAVVPRHSHPNEEFGQIIKGSLELTWGTDTTVLQVGEAFLIPGDMPHSAIAGPDGCELLECYSPPRNPDPASQTEKVS